MEIKTLRGQYPRILEKPQADTVTTNKCLSSKQKGKTEGLLVAAQDRAVNARNYKKVNEASKWTTNAECVRNMKRQLNHTVSGCEA